jgi:hypothetical protein
MTPMGTKVMIQQTAFMSSSNKLKMFRKYNAQVRKVDIFKLTNGNEGLHETSNDN